MIVQRYIHTYRFFILITAFYVVLFDGGCVRVVSVAVWPEMRAVEQVREEHLELILIMLAHC